MTVGAKEPQFYAEMLKRLDIQDLPQCFNNDEAGWIKEIKRNKTKLMTMLKPMHFRH